MQITERETATKQCRDCGLIKPLSDFAPNGSGSAGRRNFCHACQAERQRRWRAEHPEQAREHQRRYYEKTRGVSQRAYEQRNRVAQAQRRSAWKKRYPEKVRASSMKRYWIEVANGKEDVDREAIIARYGRICHICGNAIGPDEALHLDHVVPISRGGPTIEQNLRPAHARCNLRKATREGVRE